MCQLFYANFLVPLAKHDIFRYNNNKPQVKGPLNMLNISVLDAATLGDDLDLSPLRAVGQLTVYRTSTPEQVIDRIADCDAVLINKIRLGAHNLPHAKHLRLICVAATGYDNIDIDYCRAHGIAVCNVVGYSTNNVAQLTVAMALSLYTHLPAFTAHTRSGDYTRGGVANCLVPPYHEIAGKTWGIAGFGNIGSAVGRIAGALGCRVLAYKRTPTDEVTCVDFDTLCRESDILSLHLPLHDGTRGLLDARHIAMLPRGAIVINVARGAVADEAALADALESGHLAGLGIDVYATEPFSEQHPFYRLREREDVCFTPHMAWGSIEARTRCLHEIVLNMEAFLRGERRNRLD